VKTSGLFGRTVFLTSLLLCHRAGIVAQSNSPAPTKDTQIWTEVQLAITLNKKVDFVLGGTLRIGRNVTQPVDERISAGFAFKFGKYLTVSPYYLHRDADPYDHRPETEERLTVATTVRVPLGKFTLSDRNQFERRFRHPQVNATRYRNRLQIDHPFNVGRLKLTLFGSEEVFYDWSVNAWVRNRVAVGAGHTFNEHFTEDFYYLRQNDGRTHPGNLNVLGTTLRLRL
jgi:hypothetical protein